jgi:hypothetical protein
VLDLPNSFGPLPTIIASQFIIEPCQFPINRFGQRWCVLKCPKSNLSYLPNLMHIPKPSSMHTLKRKIMRMETFLKQRRCATEFAELFQNGIANARGCYPLCTYSSEGAANYKRWHYLNSLPKFWQKPNST